MMKKLTAVFLSVLTAGSCAVLSAGAAENEAPAAPGGFAAKAALYVHAVTGSADTEAWQAWQSVHDESFYEANPYEKYFFLPSSASADAAEVYNAYDSAVTLNGVEIGAGETKTVDYSTDGSYSVSVSGRTYTLRYMRSNAEAAVYINNPDADGSGTDLMTYLNSDKENKATATGAIVTPDGAVDNTAIKKIKGRGNTSWGKPKKGYNITYDKKVSVAGMTKNKKYSILPNYQDDSLARNRFLYDLSDAVGLPYASDSRFVDFYVNGYYRGAYQMAEKVEPGSLVTDVTGEEYLDENGGVKEDFPFIAEVDASAGGDDYFVTCDGGVKVTIKAPEIDPGKPGYDEVKDYVQEKFNALLQRCRTAIRKSSTSIADLIDLESAAKLYLINELGKNWDSGVSSTFLTYKPDENGSYKFYGSPVWDYDNTLGNAVGVGYELSNIGVYDYTSYEGWWCRYKGKSENETMSYNIINNLARNKEVQAVSARVWFEDFMPALRHFSGEGSNPAVADELYSAEEYYALLSGSAAMNYTSGWLLDTGSWIASHNVMKKASFDFYAGKYTVSSNLRYKHTHEGMFQYARDWMLNRAAWLSNEMYADYTGSKVRFDVNGDGQFTVNDITEVQRFLAEFITFTARQYRVADTTGNGVSVSDVTYLQRVMAGMEEGGEVKPLPAPTDPTDPQPADGVVFVNTLDWEGDICVYYYGSGQYPLTWPGTAMTQTAGIDGKDAYSFEVPDFAEYVIFTNGTVQTEKIPWDGAPHIYRAVDQLYPNGRYYYTVD